VIIRLLLQRFKKNYPISFFFVSSIPISPLQFPFIHLYLSTSLHLYIYYITFSAFTSGSPSFIHSLHWSVSIYSFPFASPSVSPSINPFSGRVVKQPRPIALCKKMNGLAWVTHPVIRSPSIEWFWLVSYSKGSSLIRFPARPAMDQPKRFARQLIRPWLFT